MLLFRLALGRYGWEHTVPDGKGEAMMRGYERAPNAMVRWLPALALAILLMACTRTPPEQRLREQLSAMQAALEDRRPGDFIEGVAADFTGDGGMDRAALQHLVRAQVLANADIGLALGPAEIELQGDRATVRFSAVASGGSGRFLPERAQAYQVTSGWRDEDGNWRLYYAEWKAR